MIDQTRDRLPSELFGAPRGSLRNPTVMIFLTSLALISWSCYGYLLDVLSPWAAIFLNAVAFYLLYTVSHEAAHRLAHEKRVVNNWMGRISAATEGTTFRNYQIAHLQHHAHTNEPARDPDRILGNRPGWALPLWLLLRAIREFTWVSRRDLWGEPGARREHLITVSVQVVVMCTAVASGHQASMLVLWIAPAILSAMTIYLVFGWLPHLPHCSTEPLENTRIIEGRVAEILTLGQSLHQVHHLWMTIPWFRYARARKAISRPVSEERHPRSEITR